MSHFLTVNEVARLMHCDHRSVRRAIKRGELEAAMVARKWLIREEAVDAWFESRAQKPLRTPRTPPRRVSPPRSTAADRPGSVGRLKAIEGGQR